MGYPIHCIMMNRNKIKQRTCKVEGCGSRHRSKGFCKIHYDRFRQHGDHFSRRIFLKWDDIDSIKKYIMENRNITKNSCWEWVKWKNPKGYGFQIIDGSAYSVHRISKAVFDGFDIHSNLFICHHCDNPPCFNPEHLFVACRMDNMIDMFNKGRGNKARGERNGSSKLTEKDVREIRNLHKNGLSYQKIAVLFGVTTGSVFPICAGFQWKHV